MLEVLAAVVDAHMPASPRGRRLDENLVIVLGDVHSYQRHAWGISLLTVMAEDPPQRLDLQQPSEC